MRKISNSQIEVELLTGRYGIVICAICDLQHQKEWLYMDNPDEGQREINKSFDEQYRGGMEFIFPGDEEETYKNILYKDHGQLWRMPFDIKQEADGIVAEGKDEYFNIYASYRLKLQDNRIYMQINLKNMSECGVPYLARLHPAFILNKNTELLLHEMEIFFEKNCAYCSFDREEVGRSLELSRPDTFKDYDLFLHIKQKKGEFTVREKDRVFRIEYDNKKLPYLTFCSFMKKHERIGILEPANVPGINLSSVEKRQPVPELRPGEKISYDFQIIVE